MLNMLRPNAEPQPQLLTSIRSRRAKSSNVRALPTQTTVVVAPSHPRTLPSFIANPQKPSNGALPCITTTQTDQGSSDGNSSPLAMYDRRGRNAPESADGPRPPATAIPASHGTPRRERFSGMAAAAELPGGEPKAPVRRRRSSMAILDGAPTPGTGGEPPGGGDEAAKPTIRRRRASIVTDDAGEMSGGDPKPSIRRRRASVVGDDAPPAGSNNATSNRTSGLSRPTRTTLASAGRKPAQEDSAVIRKTPMMMRRRGTRTATGCTASGSIANDDDETERVSRSSVNGAISNRRHSFDTSDSFDISLMFPDTNSVRNKPNQIPPLNLNPVVDKEASRRSHSGTVRFSKKSGQSRASRQGSAFDLSQTAVEYQDPRKSAQALEEMMEEMFGHHESMDFEAECKRMDNIKQQEQRIVSLRKMREQFAEEKKEKARLSQEAEEKRQEEEQYRRKLDIMGKIQNVSETVLKLMQFNGNIRTDSEEGEVEAMKANLVLEKQLQAVFESFCRHSKWMPDDVLQPSAPRRNKALKGMSVSGFVELSHQAGVQRVTFIKKVFESHCNQNTGRLDDMEDFVAAIVDLGKLQGWNPARSLQVFCSINKEGLLYIQQPGNE